MPRLYRPHIPLKVRCRVALRQLGELWPDEFLNEYEGAGWGVLLEQLLFQLSGLLSCMPEDLHLDHDPPLAARFVIAEGRLVGERGGFQQWYKPDANDPDHLIYRERHAHHIKTNVRGEHGQHPDRVLIKRARRRKRVKVKRRWPKRKMQSAKRPWPKRSFR